MIARLGITASLALGGIVGLSLPASATTPLTCAQIGLTGPVLARGMIRSVFYCEPTFGAGGITPTSECIELADSATGPWATLACKSPKKQHSKVTYPCTPGSARYYFGIWNTTTSPIATQPVRISC